MGFKMVASKYVDQMFFSKYCSGILAERWQPDVTTLLDDENSSPFRQMAAHHMLSLPSKVLCSDSGHLAASILSDDFDW